ncbi:hypothetical protein RB597_005335 [Gaeumannomyces tritici]
MSGEYTVFHGVEGVIKGTPVPKPALGPEDVLVRITHTDFCATDLAYVEYGIALGHEGVGVVEAVGPEVTQFKVGDRAGGGYYRGSCGTCRYCLTGQDIWCYERSIFGEGDYDNGTFGEYYVGRETYLHRIPDALASEHVVPLQCAGATTYNALVQVVRPGDRVGIVGIGGLGHLAIQIARKMGTEVVVFSTSRNKEEEAKKFGASEFHLLDELEKLTAPVDMLVVAGSKYPDWKKWVPDVCPLCCVKNLPFPPPQVHDQDHSLPRRQRRSARRAPWCHRPACLPNVLRWLQRQIEPSGLAPKARRDATVRRVSGRGPLGRTV